MIPLYVFAVIWLVILAIFIVLASLTILQMLRFGINEALTKYVTLVFVVISVIIIGLTLFGLSRIDLTEGINLQSTLDQFFIPTNQITNYD